MDKAFDSVLTTQTLDIKAEKSGYIASINALKLGDVAMKIGAGRATKEDKIDHNVGLLSYRKVGDYIQKGDVLLRVDYNKDFSDMLIEDCLSAYTLSDLQTEKPEVVFEIIK